MNSEDVHRHNFFSLFSSPRYREKDQSNFRMYYKSQLGPFMQHPYELLMENASGEPLHVEMSLASIHFKGIWNAIAIFRDVTAHVQEERRERESWINAVLQGSPIPQFMIDTNHTIIFWNRALEEYTGIKAGDIIGTKQQWRAFMTLNGRAWQTCSSIMLLKKFPGGTKQNSVNPGWWKVRTRPQIFSRKWEKKGNGCSSQQRLSGTQWVVSSECLKPLRILLIPCSTNRGERRIRSPKSYSRYAG